MILSPFTVLPATVTCTATNLNPKVDPKDL